MLDAPPSALRIWLAMVWLLYALPLAQAEELLDLNPCPQALSKPDARLREEGEKWDITLSPFAYHWTHNPEHRPVFLMAVDRHVAGDRFCGIALFRNSFGQPAAYVYVGQQWKGILGQPNMFTKLSVGLIDGYRGKYKDQIPFNRYGIAPAFIPSLGYHINPQDSFQLMVLGNTAILLAYSHTF